MLDFPSGRRGSARLGLGRNEPAWIEDVDDDRTSRASSRAGGRVHAALCFPVRTGRGVVRVIELLATERARSDAELLPHARDARRPDRVSVRAPARQEAAHLGDQRTRAMLEAALDAVVAIDHTGTIIAFNPRRSDVRYDADSDARRWPSSSFALASRAPPRRPRPLPVTGKGPVLDNRVEIVGMRSDGSEFRSS